MQRGHPNLTDPPNGVFVSSLTLKQLSDALQCFGWQPDKGALPRMGQDASPSTFTPMPARVLIASEVQPFDEDAEHHGSLSRAAQDFTSCRASMGLVVALPHLGQVAKPWTAGRAPILHHDVHEVQPFCLPSSHISAPEYQTSAAILSLSTADDCPITPRRYYGKHSHREHRGVHVSSASDRSLADAVNARVGLPIRHRPLGRRRPGRLLDHLLNLIHLGRQRGLVAPTVDNRCVALSCQVMHACVCAYAHIRVRE